jgi:hypothetical protein
MHFPTFSVFSKQYTRNEKPTQNKEKVYSCPANMSGKIARQAMRSHH